MDGTAHGGAVRIGVQNVGSRVVIRYRLRTEDHGPHGEALTDVIGVLVGWERPADAVPGSGGAATVERASGERVVVPLDAVVAAKTVPPAPVRRKGAGPQSGH
jgi:N-acetylglutamate synthase